MRKMMTLLTIVFVLIFCVPTQLGDSPVSPVHPTKIKPFKYHNYNSLVAEMKDLNNTYPHIVDLVTAQDAFGIPDVAGGLKIWILRVTNESSLTPDRPEVLFIGLLHGDEPLGVEITYEYVSWLARNYATDPYLKYLVDNREIYVIPCNNPYGWTKNSRYDENGEDPNRDYPYDYSTSGSQGPPLSSKTSKTVHELMKQHLFINMISFHGGTHIIGYAWGCYAHNTPTDESPDDRAFSQQGKYMSKFAGSYGEGLYRYGPANQVIYPCYGALEDYAYACSWDKSVANPNYPTEGCRALTHCVETSGSKKPPESKLGTDEDIYTPGGQGDGYVPKNIRLCLLLTDVASPYVNITNWKDIPSNANPGQQITFKWLIGGAFTTTSTQILYGKNPDPINNYEYATQNKSGGTRWDDVEYSESLNIPSQPGDYYFVIRATVDQDTTQQTNPEPNVPPQSLYVNMRTNASWSISNGGNTLKGQLNWYSEIIRIKVGGVVQPEVHVITPNGGETWENGTTKKIEWVVKNLTSFTTKLDYSISGNSGPWSNIADGVTGTTYDWKIPYVPSPGSSNCFVKVTVTSGSTKISDISDNEFTILNKTVGGDITPPAKVTDLVCENPTMSTITLRWTAPGDDGTTGTATEYDIRYLENTPVDDSTWSIATQCTNEPSPNPSGSIEKFTVDNLKSDTKYYFALKTSDEIPNWSSISNTPYAVTLESDYVLAYATISPSAHQTLLQNKKLYFKSEGKCANGTTIPDVQFSWTVEGGIGYVTCKTQSSTTFVATTPGEGKIKVDVIYKGISKSNFTKITVEPSVGDWVLHKIEISPESPQQLKVGDTKNFTVKGLCANGSMIPSDLLTIKWSVKGGIGNVNPTNEGATIFKATGVGDGKIIVKVIYKGVTKSKSVEITVITEQKSVGFDVMSILLCTMIIIFIRKLYLHPTRYRTLKNDMRCRRGR